MAGTQPRAGIIQGINVTPLVDVVLVLLVVLMVTAKVAVTSSVPVDLPQASEGEEVSPMLQLAVGSNGRVELDGAALSDRELESRVRAQVIEDRELRAVIRADTALTHGRVIEILDVLRRAGLVRVAFAADRSE